MQDIKGVAKIIAQTANYYQIPIEDVLQWIKNEIIDVENQECFHYEVKK